MFVQLHTEFCGPFPNTSCRLFTTWIDEAYAQKEYVHFAHRNSVFFFPSNVSTRFYSELVEKPVNQNWGWAPILISVILTFWQLITKAISLSHLQLPWGSSIKCYVTWEFCEISEHLTEGVSGIAPSLRRSGSFLCIHHFRCKLALD